MIRNFVADKILPPTIDKTLETVPENPTVEAQTKVITTLTPQIEGITDLLVKATKAATSKDFLSGVTGDTLSAVLSLVNEVVYTVKAIIAKLGLGKSHQLIAQRGDTFPFLDHS